MKIHISFLLAIFTIFCLFPVTQAQIIVVKQDGSLVYLDTSEYNRTVDVGDSFKIVISQEKLINPKTGKDLGTLNHYSAAGKIIEVQPLYAIGQMPTQDTYAIGQQAIMVLPSANTVSVPSQTARVISQHKAEPTPVSTRKIKTYTAIDHEIISAAQADLTALPGEEIAAVDTEGSLLLYQPEEFSLHLLASHKLPMGQKPLTLSAKDIMNSGHAQLFVVVYKEKEQKISTMVFDLQDKEFKQVAVLPYFVKELGCNADKELYAQKPFIRNGKAGDAHELIYQNGRFSLDTGAMVTRGHWLTGLAYYEIQNKDTENFIYTASNGRLRLLLANGKFTDSPALFSTAPNRVKYKQEILRFYPSLQVYGPQGRATLAGIENTTKMGLLSEQFGQYHGGKIHFLTYDNGSLRVQETLELTGFAYDTNCTQRGILVPQVLSGGQTVLAEIYR